MTDVLLTVAVCVTQLALGYMGVHVALKPRCLGTTNTG
jgi:hypothetical protein